MTTCIPRLYAAASLKPSADLYVHAQGGRGIPRLYAAASLKRGPGADGVPPNPPVFRGFMPRPH